jgi:probable biosynthetic protein (TIGR04098 family)
MMTQLAPSMSLPFSAKVERTGSASLRRELIVQPGMCGPTQALAACVGDWTWETVSTVSELDVFTARDEFGAPTYLSFLYFHIISGGRLHPKQLAFGDRLVVDSQVFDAGSRSVLTVHRVRRVAGRRDAGIDIPFDAAELHTRPRVDCLYFENLNVWISRGNSASNVGLVRSAPVGFRSENLPKLPAEFSPRALCNQTRALGAFPDPATSDWPRTCPDMSAEYRVDLARDVNGVGLLYFASFFAITEHALSHQWASLGRSAGSFLERTISDARIYYAGNADLNANLALDLRTRHHPDDRAKEKNDVLVRDLSTGRAIAFAAFHHTIAR